MKEQWERYAVLNLGLVIPESLLRAKVESKKKLRDVIFNDRAVFMRSPPSTLIKRTFERHQAIRWATEVGRQRCTRSNCSGQSLLVMLAGLSVSDKPKSTAPLSNSYSDLRGALFELSHDLSQYDHSISCTGHKINSIALQGIASRNEML
jgi:hypothetical protein